ncbi:MAG: DUF434 domain-containing protein [Planctomycetota bacterium]|nr:MAG: DUF434 domain-containing protein [Planctomycetota bacterium]
MPDRRTHRGKHPEDERLFAPSFYPVLREAVADLSWLLSRGYSMTAGLKLVGDRYRLSARQRMAVRRSACSDDSLARRRRSMFPLAAVEGRAVSVDGYNLLITVESALAGGVLLIGRDGCYRDLASLHGTYRKVEETAPALRLVRSALEELGVTDVTWYLDRPVSNSGRLKAFIEETIGPAWKVELVDSPDAAVRNGDDLVISSDSVVLDDCGAWINLAAYLVERSVERAWTVDLRPEG